MRAGLHQFGAAEHGVEDVEADRLAAGADQHPVATKRGFVRERCRTARRRLSDVPDRRLGARRDSRRESNGGTERIAVRWASEAVTQQNAQMDCGRIAVEPTTHTDTDHTDTTARSVP